MPGGTLVPAADVAALTSLFVRIASESGAADGLVAKFGEVIGDMVADRLVLDYL